MKKTTLLLALLTSFQSFAAQAGNDPRLDHYLSLSLEDLLALEVTISTDTKQRLAKAPAVVTVITADDIKTTGATNLSDILEGVPGVHVRASQFAYRPLVHFRGANATQTLLMVNGAPMKDLMWGFGIFWKGLPASIIERIEIIRGPGSALFGSDAAAGVINVITKTAGKIDHTEAGARLGSFDTGAISAQHGGTWNGFDIGFTADLSTSAGHDPWIGADRQFQDDPGLSYAPGHAGFGWNSQDIRFSVAKGNWRLHADHMRHGDLETGFTGAGVLDPVTRASDSQYNIDLFYSNARFAEDWGLDAELRYRHLDYSSGAGFQERPPGYDDGTTVWPIGVINRMASAERGLDFEVKGLYTGFSGHLVRVGAGYTWQDLYEVRHVKNFAADPALLIDVSDTADAFAPEKARKISYLYAQDIWTLAEHWELTAGARYDHYSDFGDTVNPRLALVWQTTDRLTTKLMYGQAFRAPSYQELYCISCSALPNADLEPERSSTWDLSFAYKHSRNLQLGLGLFHLEQQDLIAPVAGQFDNSGDHTIRGIELEALWQATPALRIAGNYSQRDQETTSQSVLVPNREAYLRADWTFLPRWNWNLQANWLGKRSRPDGDTRPALDAHTLVDTTLRYAPGDNWEFAVSVRNLFDTDAREYTSRAIPDDLPLPERNFFAEIRYKFK